MEHRLWIAALGTHNWKSRELSTLTTNNQNPKTNTVNVQMVPKILGSLLFKRKIIYKIFACFY